MKNEPKGVPFEGDRYLPYLCESESISESDNTCEMNYK